MLTVLFAIATYAPPQGDDLAALTKGVAQISQVGSPGIVSVIGPDAFAFVVGSDGGARPIAAAAKLGRGKVVAISHGGYLSVGATKTADNGRLLANMVNWVSRRKRDIKVGILGNESAGLGQALGFTEVHVTPRNLLDADVIVTTGALDAATVRNYVMKGGGLIVGQTPWGWKQVHHAESLLGELEWNSVLADAGIVYSDGIADRPKPVKSADESDHLSASAALNRLGEDANAVGLITAAIHDCPENAPFAKAVRDAVRGSSVKVPTKENPVTEKDGLSRLSLVLRDMDRRELDRRGMRRPEVDPSAASFPGSVPASEPRVKKSVLIAVNDAQWASTGLYAAPGEVITVTLPESLRGRGLGLQIGVHSDELWHLKKWERNPSVVVHASISGTTAELSSPFGGLVVITVPKNLGLKPQRITIENAVVSPRFVLGETTVAQWQASLSSSAPWAELQSQHLILSVPTEAARKVENPTALMELWDRVLGLYTEMDGSPLTVRPERIVADREISAGYMHSGYPIMTWMDDSVPLSLSYDRLVKDGTWGHWHELGHNRQLGWWTFDGTGEVTNNVYVLYTMNKINGKSVFARIGQDKKKTDAYLAAPNFEKWKSEPFVALTMYAQLIDAFGWDSYKAVIRSYLHSSESDLPKSDDEKRDQWLIRYSNQVHRNLAPFFAKWGIPVSEAAKAAVNGLPDWAG